MEWGDDNWDNQNDIALEILITDSLWISNKNGLYIMVINSQELLVISC
jgi:hypothetical protein